MTGPNDLEGWKARALAAERTVAILKAKVVELYNGGGSILQHAVERARAREAESRRRQELMALRNAELVRYSARLEAEVAARTRDLQVILDNVAFGFLVVDRDGAIRDGYTRSCLDLLGRESLSGESLGSALGFSAASSADLALALGQVFDDLLPTELTLDQLPHRAAGPGGRTLRLEGRVVRGADGAVDGVLVTLSDITALEAAQRDNAHYRLLVQLLRQREAFVGFVTDFRALVSDALAAVASGQQALARRAIHTMKGNAACFELDRVAALAHEIEGPPEIDAAGITRLSCALDEFLAHNVDVLGVADADAAISITTEDLAGLERAVGHPAAIARWIDHMRRRPVRVMLAPIEALVPRLAERFAKRVELVVEGAELRVDPQVLAPVVRELGHVVRNAIDHGIEPAGQRGQKASTARLRIRFGESTTDYEIEIDDDGRGIDVDRLVARARQMRCDAASLANRTYDELLELVFVDGLSTAEVATDVSGRGVGMSAVCAAVSRVGGEIRVQSQPGAGTRIAIRVPRDRARERAA